MSLHLIALGANSGVSRAANARKVAAAIGRLRATFGQGLRLSNLYATPAWPIGAGPDFVNAAAAFRSELPSRAVLDRLHRIEARLGRTRSVRWGARVLDLDLIASGARSMPDDATLRYWMRLPPSDQVLDTPDRLILPHPRVQDRAFVLIPLSEVAPEWRHPLTGRSVAQMCTTLPAHARKGIRRLGPVA